MMIDCGPGEIRSLDKEILKGLRERDQSVERRTDLFDHGPFLLRFRSSFRKGFDYVSPGRTQRRVTYSIVKSPDWSVLISTNGWESVDGNILQGLNISRGTESS